MREIKPKDTFIEDPPVRWVTISGNIKYHYDFPIGNNRINLFLFSSKLMRRFGLKGDKLVAVETLGDLIPGMVLLYNEDCNFNIGRLIYDPLTELFAIESGKRDLVFLPDADVLGEPLGCCDIDNINPDLLKFRKISLRY